MTVVASDPKKADLLRTETDYNEAMEELDQLLALDPEPDTAAYRRLEYVSVLVEQYEDEMYPIDDVTPQAAVEFMLEQKGMTRADLAELLGGKARVSEFLSGKRRLSLNQVRALNKALGIPADILIRE